MSPDQVPASCAESVLMSAGREFSLGVRRVDNGDVDFGEGPCGSTSPGRADGSRAQPEGPVSTWRARIGLWLFGHQAVATIS